MPSLCPAISKIQVGAASTIFTIHDEHILADRLMVFSCVCVCFLNQRARWTTCCQKKKMRASPQLTCSALPTRWPKAWSFWLPKMWVTVPRETLNEFHFLSLHCFGGNCQRAFCIPHTVDPAASHSPPASHCTDGRLWIYTCILYDDSCASQGNWGNQRFCDKQSWEGWAHSGERPAAEYSCSTARLELPGRDTL